jgi:hypothetical protein
MPNDAICFPSSNSSMDKVTSLPIHVTFEMLCKSLTGTSYNR